MPYHLCFLLCGICLVVAGCMSVCWFAITGDSKYVKLTAKMGGGIVAIVAVVLLTSRLLLSLF